MTAKDLKNALLQEAVQGKLVPQIASEGNARDLLEEIRKERGESLPLATARKRSSATPSAGSNAARNACSKSHSELVSESIPEDEIPFDIPESWCWVRITDISTCELGKTKDTQKNTGTLKDYLCSINIQEDGIDLSKVKQMKFEDSEFERYTVRQNDLLICEGGDAGRCAVYDRETPMYYQNALHRVRFFKDINPLFYLYILQLYKANNILMEASKGVTIQHLTGAALKSLLFPLPPLAEQRRIVAAIEKFMPLIEEYGKKETVLNQLNAQIGTLTKKAILQEAVQGKLVPQIPAEGNAKDLLEQIKAQKAALIKEGKIKKEKPLPEITEDEIPFDIPENWCWCRLGEIFQVIMGQSPEGINVGETIEGIEFHQGKIFFTDRYIAKSNQQTSEITKIAEPESILLCMRAPVGKVNLTNRKICIGRGLSAIVPLGGLLIEWAFHLFETLEYDFIKKSTGSTFKAITGDIVKEELIPLPPLSEQKRIVAAIEQLLPLCEKLGR